MSYVDENHILIAIKIIWEDVNKHKVKQMDYRTNIWHPLNKDRYRWAWNEKKIVGFFQEFRRDLRRCRERIWKGYCDYDLFSICSWFLGIMPTMLEEFRDNLHGHPVFSGSISHRVIVDKCDESSEEFKIWKEILSKMIFLLRESNEETCSKTNPFEDEYKTISDLYLAEEEKLGKYRKECTDKALALFSRWFNDLWD